MNPLRNRFFWIVCGALLCLAASEAAYRIARTDVCVGRDGGSFFVAHPDYGWGHIPDASVWMYGCSGRDYEFQNHVRTNSKGLRNREAAYEKPDGTLRVLLLGDTITEAAQVADDQTFAELSEAKLRERFGNIEVINAGCAGYGTDNELLFFRAEGARYHADLVVLVLSTRNDAIDVSEALNERSPLAALFPPKRYFTLDASGALQRREEITARPARPVADSADGIWSYVRANLFLVRALERTLDSHTEPEAPERDVIQAATWRLIYESPMSEEVVRGWLLVERLVEALGREVRASGGELLVAVMPGREEVESELRRSRFQGSDTTPGGWEIHQGNRMARSLLERLEIPYVDLSPALREHARSTGSTGFYSVDVHLAPQGHDVVAAGLVEWLTPFLSRLSDRSDD